MEGALGVGLAGIMNCAKRGDLVFWVLENPSKMLRYSSQTKLRCCALDLCALARVVGGHAVEAGAGLLVGVAHGRGRRSVTGMPLGFLRGASLLVGVAHGRGRTSVTGMPLRFFVFQIYTSKHV